MRRRNNENQLKYNTIKEWRDKPNRGLLILKDSARKIRNIEDRYYYNRELICEFIDVQNSYITLHLKEDIQKNLSKLSKDELCNPQTSINKNESFQIQLKEIEIRDITDRIYKNIAHVNNLQIETI